MTQRNGTRSIRFYGTVLAATVMLTGCAQQRNALQAQSRVNPVTSAAYPTPRQCPATLGSVSDTRPGAIDLDCFVFPEEKAIYATEYAETDTRKTKPYYRISDRKMLAYSRATTTDDYRNRLTSILIKQSDDICIQELGRLTANEATTNAALSIVGTGLSTAATIVGGELAKSILAGGATLAGASRDHINVHVYRNTIAQAVSQVIASERKSRLGDILKHYTESRTIWSIDDAIRDVNAYHGQCSFFKGLELLLKAADNNSYLQSYRNELARRTKQARLDDGMSRIEQTIRSVGPNDPSIPDLKKELATLAGKRAALDLADGDDDVPPPGNAN